LGENRWEEQIVVVYERYGCDPSKDYRLIEVLLEGRGDPKKIIEDSVLNLGKRYFGNNLDLCKMFFIEAKINGEPIYFLQLISNLKGKSIFI
jgi:hypothetical protein